VTAALQPADSSFMKELVRQSCSRCIADTLQQCARNHPPETIRLIEQTGGQMCQYRIHLAGVDLKPLCILMWTTA
jgi:hypothetical protein